ncbi:Rho-type gtpase-activating protein [Microbotryomycetes sp. JL221]|nr:Rho-type gtpase-activating protein [Microbotryomycetes sp. JL221]
MTTNDHATTTTTADQAQSNGEPIVCNACKQGLEETMDNTVVSCSNKIEELIFAKTTAGIWCMSCHNERVARTRKHAEAKRNKSGATSSRVKEGSSSLSGRSRPKTEKDKLSQRSAPANNSMAGDSDAASTSGYFDIPTLASSSSGTRPLPPSPYGHGPTASTSTMSLADLASSSVNSAAPRPSRQQPRIPLVNVRPSSSSNSLTDLARNDRGTAPSTLPRRDETRTPTTDRLGDYRSASPSVLGRSSAADNHLRRASGDSLPPPRPPSAEPLRLDPSPPASARLPHVPFSQQQLQQSRSGPTNLDDRSASPAMGSYPGTRNGSLSAPGQAIDGSGAPNAGQKAANRRSGFYGAMSLQGGSFDAGRLVPQESEDVGPTQDNTNSGRASPAPAPPPNDELQPGSAPLPPPPTFAVSDELHNSMSFYEPDTLLFLDHVGSLPGSPNIGSSNNHHKNSLTNRRRSSGVYVTDRAGDSSMDHIEHLSPDVGGTHAYSDDEDDVLDDNNVSGRRTSTGGGRVARPNDVARKVRESIRLSKASGDGDRGSSGKGVGLDVELVEMLLGELDVTKKEMKDLQEKYNAFRRVSRSAFEGFSMAREEYDKELAARRDTEARMDQLRAKFVEQAQRLATIDKEQKQAEALKRQSKELRNSVMGMEKHLSVLKAEVELSTAQAAELVALETTAAPERQANGDRSSAASVDLVQNLTARLESVKDAHRQEIKDLVEQRDNVAREVALLKQDRDSLLEDISSLTARQTELTDKNTESNRELEALRDSMNKMRLMAGSSSALGTAAAQNRLGQHHHSASSSSLAMSARSVPLSTRNISSPQPSSIDLGEMHRVVINKPEHAEHSVAKKFKWGKVKTTVDAPRQALVSSLSKSPALTNRTGDVNGKSHSFQQVSILRPVRCDYCGDKIWGLNEVRCTSCGSYAHAKCSGYLAGPCNVTMSTAGSQSQDDTMTIISQAPVMFGNDLSAQVKAEGRDVPLVVSKCIAAVEAYGMAYEGIYRKTGGMGQTKLITQFFERGQDFDLEDLDKFNDLAAITSCLKNFFRCLPKPLFTHELHEEFVACAEMPEGEARLNAVDQALQKLPDAHYETARILFLHLHRVHLSSNENKMTPANLGVVFGPTVLRSSVASREWSDMGPKAKLVEILVEHAPRLFKQPRRATVTAV